MPRVPEIERFWLRVEKTETCWLWQGEVRKPSGFGTFYGDAGRPLAHRFSWELVNGPVPGGKAVHHSCPNRHCVNSTHLVLGPKGAKQRALSERFWRFVKRGGGCWLWQGAPHTSGYGRISRPGVGAGMEYAHRASWELHFGQLPEDKWVAHTCDTKLCVNPAHLFLSDKNKQNMADATQKHRMPHGERHANHKLTDAQVASIRRLAAAGSTQQAIANQFGCSRAYVSELINRRKRQRDRTVPLE